MARGVYKPFGWGVRQIIREVSDRTSSLSDVCPLNEYLLSDKCRTDHYDVARTAHVFLHIPLYVYLSLYYMLIKEKEKKKESHVAGNEHMYTKSNKPRALKNLIFLDFVRERGTSFPAQK